MYFHKYKNILLTLFLAVIFNLILLETGVKFTKKHYNLTEKEKKIVLLFRNDDISAHSDPVHEEQVLELFQKYNIRQLFGIIPERMLVDNKKDASLVENQKVILQKLKKWKKSGLIDYGIHGYAHIKSRNSSGEFYGLSYKDQYAKIKSGKDILDKLLDDNVEMFIPPWNQADKNTIMACKDAGVKLFSGYLGEYPIDEIVFVNSNATLISNAKDYYNNKSLDIKLYSIKELLPYFEKIEGTQIMTLLYHSRTDFKNKKNFTILEKFLAEMDKNGKIEFSDFNSVQKKYENQLKMQNLAGLNIKEAIKAIQLTKPYRVLFQYFFDSSYFQNGINSMNKNYWIANFSFSQSIANKLVKKCDSIIILGRYLLFGIALMIYVIAYRYIMNDISKLLMISISLILVGVTFILYQTNIFDFSIGRKMELFQLSILNAILLICINLNIKRKISI